MILQLVSLNTPTLNIKAIDIIIVYIFFCRCEYFFWCSLVVFTSQTIHLMTKTKIIVGNMTIVCVVLAISNSTGVEVYWFRLLVFLPIILFVFTGCSRCIILSLFTYVVYQHTTRYVPQPYITKHYRTDLWYYLSPVTRHEEHEYV